VLHHVTEWYRLLDTGSGSDLRSRAQPVRSHLLKTRKLPLLIGREGGKTQTGLWLAVDMLPTYTIMPGRSPVKPMTNLFCHRS